MLFASLYLVARRLFGLAGGSRSVDLSKDVEILVLRHQLKSCGVRRSGLASAGSTGWCAPRRAGCSPVQLGPRSWWAPRRCCGGTGSSCGGSGPTEGSTA